jgi:hypothetical protein
VSDRTRPRFVKQTPIERIFENVMHRKMTQSERLAFRLEPLKIDKKTKLASRNGGNDEHSPDLK